MLKIQHCLSLTYLGMGVGKIFFMGAIVDFSGAGQKEFFEGWAKSSEISLQKYRI